MALMQWTAICLFFETSCSLLHFVCSVLTIATWPWGQRIRFYDDPDCMIRIQHVPWSRCCVLGQNALRRSFLLVGIEQTANSVNIVKKSKALNFQSSFFPHSLLKSWIMGNDRKSAITRASVRNEFFCDESKELRCLSRYVALRFENLLTSSRYFSELNNLSLNGLAM